MLLDELQLLLSVFEDSSSAQLVGVNDFTALKADVDFLISYALTETMI